MAVGPGVASRYNVAPNTRTGEDGFVAPPLAFSLIIVTVAILLILASMSIAPGRRRKVAIEHATLFATFFILMLGLIALRQWSAVPLTSTVLLTAVVFWEEIQKGIASRISKLNAISICTIFVAVELIVTKANLLLPTAGYLDDITKKTLPYDVIIVIPSIGFHVLTGVLYHKLRRWHLWPVIFLCTFLHLAFNAAIPLF